MQNEKVELNEVELKKVSGGAAEISTDILANLSAHELTEDTKDIDMR